MPLHMAPQRWQAVVGETRIVSVSFVDVLESGELLTGTPLVVETTTADLTLANKAVNTSTLTILNQSCVAGQAIQFTMTGQQAGTCYIIKLTCGTDATPAQTLIRGITVIGVAAPAG